MKSIRHLLFTVFVLFAISALHGQYKPSNHNLADLPDWAQEMYSDTPNVHLVVELYEKYHAETPFEKSVHTQYYKRFIRRNADYVNSEGFVDREAMEAAFAKQTQRTGANRSADWSQVGPILVTYDGVVPGHEQSNVYCIDQSLSNPDVLYAGTEPGEVFKSVDGGQNWFCVSMDDVFYNPTNFIWNIGVTALKIHPELQETVLAGGDAGIFRTTNGAETWESVYSESNFGANEIVYSTANPSRVFVAADKGLFRSTDGGSSWQQLFTEKCYDIKYNTANANELYLLKNDPAQNSCTFWKSTDGGDNWNQISNGWYSSSDPARQDEGARLAVTPADPNRVYAYLIGQAKNGDHGFIGVFRSDNGGDSWTLPNPPAGGPYTTNHPNLAIGWVGWNYHQGFYNCALMASETNPDHILIGGLNLWRSNDGGVSFSPVGGYVGNQIQIHVDMQDFRAINGTYWITTDGGIYKSTDFANTQPDFKMRGLRGSDYWGFGSGWNEDVLVGGLYHNGNLAWHENYGEGNFLSLGGGEEPTGYVNPGNNRKTYYSDIQGVMLPVNYTDEPSYFPVGMFPTEAYWPAESSRMEFHPNCYNIAYLGRNNQIWKTEDGGTSYALLHTFNVPENHRVQTIEISSDDPNVMYVSVRPSFGNTGALWKTTDGGANWQQLQIPPGNSRRILLTGNPLDVNELWMAYPGGSNGFKVFHTNDGGETWNNITGPELNFETIHAMEHVAGTNGGLYVGTQFSLFYRNNASGVWVNDSEGLPTYFNSNIIHPFYRDGKIRVASYGKGIWERPMQDVPSEPIARITVDKLRMSLTCVADSFYFDDYSFLNHANASWNWTFENGSPAESAVRNPAVAFTSSGAHLVTLTVTDQNGVSSTDSLYISIDPADFPSQLEEGFENGFPGDYFVLENEEGANAWSVSSDFGAFGTSSNSAVIDNYNTDAGGAWSDMRFLISAEAIDEASVMTFDLAYAPYPGYSDRLQVLLSTDCGETFEVVYDKEGEVLQTTEPVAIWFDPEDDQWRTETVSLAAIAGASEAMIAIRNIGLYGNYMFIDNINLDGTSVNVSERYTEQLTLFPNPVVRSGALNLRLDGFNDSHVRIRMINMEGKVVSDEQVNLQGNVFTLEAPVSAGVYLLNVEGSERIYNMRFVVR